MREFRNAGKHLLNDLGQVMDIVQNEPSLPIAIRCHCCGFLCKISVKRLFAIDSGINAISRLRSFIIYTASLNAEQFAFFGSQFIENLLPAFFPRFLLGADDEGIGAVASRTKTGRSFSIFRIASKRSSFVMSYMPDAP